MTMGKLYNVDVDNLEDLEESEVGREYLFVVPGISDEATFRFASRFQHIGHVEYHDCVLKNKTRVLVLSEPTEAVHPKMGPMLVSKIMAHTVMWVGTNNLVPIDER